MANKAKFCSPIFSTFEALVVQHVVRQLNRIMLTEHSGVSAPQLEREAHALQRKIPLALK